MAKLSVRKKRLIGLTLGFCVLAGASPWAVQYHQRHAEEHRADRWGLLDAEGRLCEVVVKSGRVDVNEWLDVMRLCRTPERRNEIYWGRVQSLVVGCSLGADFEPGSRLADVVQVLADGAEVYFGGEASVQHALLVAQLLKSDWKPVAAPETLERREEALSYLHLQSERIIGAKR